MTAGVLSGRELAAKTRSRVTAQVAGLTAVGVKPRLAVAKPEDLATGIDPGKDVDGANPLSLGRLASGLPTYAPATAEAVAANRHATVTICHSRTRGLAAITRQAEILSLNTHTR